MTVLRCTAKLLKRLRQPAKPPEPEAHANPLGEWYADIDFWRRQPFVVLLNAATGAVLVLPGNAAGLRVLHENAALQFAAICEHFKLRGAGVAAELESLNTGFTFASTRDRSLLASLNQCKWRAGCVWNMSTARLPTLLCWSGMACSNTPRWAAIRITTWHITCRWT